jgi:hypothetical protein
MAKRIHLRPSLLDIRRKSVKWIIVHHTAEIYEFPESRIDNNKYQMPGIYAGVLEKKQGDVNYHYVLDKIKGEYNCIACRPIVYLCDWPDIPADINKRAVHVALMGSYDYKVPEKRMYEILAFRLLNPMIKLFGISPNRIKMHYEVTKDKDLSCPGDFINKDVIIAMTRRYVVK